MTDITTREDVVRLVDDFYDDVQRSPVIGGHFASIDWLVHKPIMYSFWSSILLGDQSYKRNPFEKHIPLKLSGKDFEEWLRLFKATMDKLYSGPNADELKQRAESIARVWQYKLTGQ